MTFVPSMYVLDVAEIICFKLKVELVGQELTIFFGRCAQQKVIDVQADGGNVVVVHIVEDAAVRVTSSEYHL